MDDLCSLYDEISNKGVKFFSWDLDDEKAVAIEMNGKCAVFMDCKNIQTESEEKVVVAHEGGHIFTGAMHKLSSPYDLIERHEHKAWVWAYKKLLPKEELERAILSGYTEVWQIAEYFDLPEFFVENSIIYYRENVESI